MRRKSSILLILVLLMPFASVGIKASSSNTYLIPEGSTVLDCVLNEWGSALVFYTISPVQNTEYLFFYFMYNDTHLLIAGYLYDPDNLPDDTVRIYINTSTGIQVFNITEGSSSSWFVTVKSLLADPYWCFESAIPNSSIGLHSFRVLIEYESTHVKTHRVYIPYNANMSDPSTWLTLEYYVPPPTAVTIKLNLMDRQNNTLKPIENVTLVKLYNTTWESGYIVALGSSVEYNVSGGLYNVSVMVYGNKVYRFSVDTTQASEYNISIPNVIICNISGGYIVVTVGENSTIEGVLCKTDIGYLSTVVNASADSSVWIDSITPWKYVCVLFSDNFTYNPISNHLLSVTPRGRNSIVVITGEDEPVIYSSNSSIIRDTYDPCTQLLSVLLNASTEIKIYHTVKPVAVVLNCTALKYNTDWTFDNLLNITSIKTGKGILSVYYAIPVSFTVSSSQKLTIFISSPYAFRGRIVIPEANIDKSVNIVYGSNKFEFDLPAGTYTIKIYDTDSNILLGTTTTTITEVAPEEVTVEVVPLWTYAVILVLCMIVLFLAVCRGAQKTLYKHSKYWIKTFPT